MKDEIFRPLGHSAIPRPATDTEGVTSVALRRSGPAGRVAGRGTTRPLRILFLTTHLEIGGIGRYIANLAVGLVRHGHTVIVASGGGALEPGLTQQGVVCWRIPLRTKQLVSPRVLISFLMLAARLKRQPVDVIHAHTRVSHVVAALLWRSRKIPYVTTWHGFFRRRMGRRIFPCVGLRTIAISQAVADGLHQIFGVSPDHIRLIHTGIDLVTFAPPPAADVTGYRRRWRIAAQAPVVGTMARLVPSKGIAEFIAAFARLARNRSDVEALIIGDGEAREALAAQARQLGVSERVHFTGTVQDTTVPLAAMDVFVFSGTGPEGLGLSIMEAMAMRKPVVASRIGGVASLVWPGQTGTLVPPGDDRAMAAAIEALLSHPDDAALLGRQGRALLEREFTLHRMVERIAEVYREVACAAG